MPTPGLRFAFLFMMSGVFAWSNTAIEPAPRDDAWRKRHEEFSGRARQGGIDVLFVGDSITEQWGTVGKDVWAENFASMRAAYFGLGGDRTQHVLWRLEQGELEGLNPRVVVLLIGTNNTGRERTSPAIRNTPDETIAGVEAVVRSLRTRLPATRILLLALFPRSDDPADGPVRAEIATINQAVARLHDGQMIHFLDVGPKFLAADGTIPDAIMPDHLHLSPAGYQLWADALREPLRALLK